jgi:hypothetical protein
MNSWRLVGRLALVTALCTVVWPLRAQTSYWCAMHPDIRGKAGDVCPICRMPLVPAPSAQLDAYTLDFRVTPSAPRPGHETLVRFFVRTPHTDSLVRQFETVHERLVHFFVLSNDLQFFQHLHPVLQTDGSFEQRVILPREGIYRVIADFLPTGAAPQLVQHSIVTAAYRGSIVPDVKLPVDLAPKVVEGVRVAIHTPEPVGGREQLVTFDLDDAVTHAPITNLEPFLGAVGHLLIVSSDLQYVAHSHPVALMSTALGPQIVFQVLFPRAGDYKLWMQCQRGGRVLTAAFTIKAQPRDQVFGK